MVRGNVKRLTVAIDADVGVVVGDTDGPGGVLLGLGALVALEGVLVVNSGAVGISPERRPVISSTVATMRAAAASAMSPNSQRGSRYQGRNTRGGVVGRAAATYPSHSPPSHSPPSHCPPSQSPPWPYPDSSYSGWA